MRQGASRTATLVALYRAIESTRATPTRLFEDPFAPAFLGWRFKCALRLSRLPGIGTAFPWSLIDGHWAGPRGTVAVRTRYIDDALGDALRDGVDQVVILGAGFDCRALRIRGIDRVPVFEVDHPVTQARKKVVVVRCLGGLPPHITLVPIDFTTHSLDTVMPAAGYRSGSRTFFICEGVTHYLSEPAVDALFRFVAGSAAGGSRMVFTYIHRGMLEGAVTFPGAANTLATVQRAGEPYTFGIDPAELSPYLATHHLRLVEDVGAATYRERYLRPLGREQQPLAEFQRAALVEVAAAPIRPVQVPVDGGGAPA
jgi:methyltransferase (TIGR00027 family)